MDHQYYFGLLTHQGYYAEQLGWAYGTKSLRIFKTPETRDQWVQYDTDWREALTHSEAQEWMIRNSDAWIIRGVYGDTEKMTPQDVLGVYLEGLVSTHDFPTEELQRTFVDGISQEEINTVYDKANALRAHLCKDSFLSGVSKSILP